MAASSWETKPRIIFPLSLLSIAPWDERGTLDAIVQYGVGAWIEKFGSSAVDGLEEAQAALHFKGGSPDAFRKGKRAGDVHVRAVGSEPDATVALPLEWCFKTRDQDGGFSFREFRVICAIYSIVGSAPYRWITQPVIESRTTGAKSEKIRQPAPAGTFLDPLTPKQTRNVLAELSTRNCFARYSPVARAKYTYYSVTMTTDSLAELVNQNYVSRAVAEQRQDTHRAILTARLEAIKGGRRQNDDQKQAAAGRPKGDINETVFKETKRNETEERRHEKAKLSRLLPSLKDLREMGYEDEQSGILDYFHACLLPLGYLPVNRYSEEVVKVLETHGSDGVEAMVAEILAEGRRPAKGSATLVRLGWDNY